MAPKSPKAALTELWRAVAGKARLPRLPRDPFEAFLKLLEAMGPLEAERGFELVDLAELPDLETVVLAEGPERAELTTAVLVSELIPFRTPAEEHVTFYLDPVADEAGKHRVYIRHEEALPGIPHGPRLDSIEEAARWLTKLATGQQVDWDDITPEDDWERSPASGAFVIETILDASPSLLWRAVADGLWPEGAGDELSALPDEAEPAWRRALCAGAMHELAETRQLTLPGEASLQKLTVAQQAFLENLAILKKAIDGELPPFLLDIAADGAHPLHEAGLAWSSRYEAVRAASKREPKPAAKEESPKEALVAGLMRVVVALEERELLEVAPGQRDTLVEHLFAAAAEAENPEKMLRRLIGAMLDSDAVEELYGDEAQLREAIIKSFRA